MVMSAPVKELAQLSLDALKTPDTAALSSALDAVLSADATSEARRQSATTFATTLSKGDVLANITHLQLVDRLATATEEKKVAGIREGAMILMEILAQMPKAAERVVEPFLVSRLLPASLQLLADKSGEVRDAADKAGRALVQVIDIHAVRLLLEKLFVGLENSARWQTKVGALDLIQLMANHAPNQICVCLPELIPALGVVLWETKPEVQKASFAATLAVCKVVGNQDIEPYLEMLVGCMARPEEVPECIFKLAAITFVTQVEAPTLAIMVPLLERALNERQSAVKRQAAVIIDNMCKLVENPNDILQFLPKLVPNLERVIEMHADPECRQVAQRALATLLHVSGEAHAGRTTVTAEDGQEKKVAASDRVVVQATLVQVLSTKHPRVPVSSEVLDYVSAVGGYLIERHNMDAGNWKHYITEPYMDAYLPKTEWEAFNHEFVSASREDMLRRAPRAEDDNQEGGVDLCNCEFSLAYGGMILLNNTRLRLKRGKRYGLCGPNGCGKTTLMRAIANGQLDGFPSKEELRTVFVEHALQGEQSEMTVLQFVVEDEHFKDVSRQEIIDTLSSVGFTDAMQQQQVGTLSGGWKMKLELARAMLMHADVLLLDEPTNHLDVANVTWLVNYLNSLTNVTSLIVSHDSGFLDRVCTNILHYEHRKIKSYIGNLAEFVKLKPEAKSYYTLESATTKFVFPEPGFLDGIKSKDKAILKMGKVSFQYPGATKLALQNVTVSCCLSSRIGVIGPNGAGKSTLIKLLTGEMIPTAGEVWKHPNLRVAYVAQHAFHHVEQHMDKTPNQYVQWRFQYGEDRELLAKDSRQISEEEQRQMEKQIVIEGEKRVLDLLFGRRKLKKSYEYEVKWVGMPYEKNTWHPREELEKWGFTKLLQRFDDKEAALQGMYKRPLSGVHIQKHFEDLGLEAEFSTHSHIRGLSGGQKLKVVIGAAMWNNPHMIVLDEPTNFIDRDSLAALAGAIRNFGGGVVIISHNREFTDALCPEQWFVDAGILTTNGATSQVAEKIEQKQEETMIDALGNVEKVKQKKKLSRKELKAREKRRKEAEKEGRFLSSDDDYEL